MASKSKRRLSPIKKNDQRRTVKDFLGEETDEDEEEGFQTPSIDENETNYNLTTSIRTPRKGKPGEDGAKHLVSSPRTRATQQVSPSRRSPTKARRARPPKGKITNKSTETTVEAGPSSGKQSILRSSKRKQSVPKRLSKEALEYRLLKDILRLQNSTNTLIPRLPFSRVIREVLLQHDQTLRITPEALMALQETSELYLTNFFEDAYRCTIHRKQVTLKVNDMQLVSQLRGGK